MSYRRGSSMGSIFVTASEHVSSKEERKRRKSFSPSHLKTAHGGFTLMEMMVVVAVIIVLTAVAVVSFRANIDNIKVHGSARTIALTMNQARIKAISENNYYVVGFRKPGDTGFEGGAITRYVIEVLDDDDNSTSYTAGEKVVSEELRPGIIYHFPPGDDFKCTGSPITGINDGINFPSNEVVFYPRGNASTDGEVYIISDNAVANGIDSNRRCIYLMNVTGKSVVYKYDQALADGGSCPWIKE